MVIADFAGGIVAAAFALPLAWKWELGMRRVLVALLAIAVVAGVIAHLAGLAVGLPTPHRVVVGAVLTVAGAAGILLYCFYRDPERTPPVADHAVISPADGQIVYVRRSRDGRLPVSTKHGHDVALEELTRTEVHDGDAIVVGIGMSLLDVHVTRAPIAGRVTLRRHFPGRFGSLKVPEMVFQNERATTVIASETIAVAVVQIASRLVRQIVGRVRAGEDVELGQRIGVIRFGSQVDLVVPDRPDVHVRVRAGDRVEAGTSVIATFGDGVQG